jgi:uncharacterized protein
MRNSLDQLVAESFDTHHLELILLPTEQCNFRCTYCYEDFKIGRMERRVIEAIKLLLYARSEDLRSLHLSWFGGEPLLAKDAVLELNNFARELYAEKHYFSSITTNGFYLNADLFCALLRSGMRHFQISLDGWREDHDVSRPTIRGNGTFDTIWQNLLETKKADSDFAITLRVHISERNCNKIIRLIDQIVAQFGGDSRYSVFLKEIVKLGGPNDSEIIPLSSAQTQDVVSSIRQKCSGLIQISTDECDAHVCYASRLNSFLIRADGRIGKCTVALNDDDNVVGILNNDGAMTLDRKKLMTWAGGLFTRNEKQLGCPLAFKNARASGQKSVGIDRKSEKLRPDIS